MRTPQRMIFGYEMPSLRQDDNRQYDCQDSRLAEVETQGQEFGRKWQTRRTAQEGKVGGNMSAKPLTKQEWEEMDAAVADHRKRKQPQGAIEYKCSAIKSGIPIPRKSGGGRRPKYHWLTMGVGDSFTVRCADDPVSVTKCWNSLSSCRVNAQRVSGRKFEMRRVLGGLGVWRVL